jgi:hypothetical protein
LVLLALWRSWNIADSEVNVKLPRSLNSCQPAIGTMVQQLPERPILVFDGDCSFCRAWVEYWKQNTADRVFYAPYQQIGDRFPDIPHHEFAKAVQLLLPNGDRF